MSEGKRGRPWRPLVLDAIGKPSILALRGNHPGRVFLGLLLVLGMLAGRLEILLLVLPFTPAFWRT